MANGMTINLADTLTNPDSEFSVASQGKNFPTESLTPNEAQKLESQLNEIILGLDSQSLANVIRDRSGVLAQTAAFSKQVFDEKLFGGINAGDNEIGFSPLRPGHIRADPANGNAINDWYFEPSSNGWNDWIGDGTSANDYTVPEDQVSVIFGLVDQDTNSELSGINVDSFGRNVDMLPQDINDMRVRDNENELQFTALPTLVAQENDRVHIRLRHDEAVESQPRLVGFTFGLGSWLNQEDY